ncbi:hypothetical protein P5G89_06205 [Serratia nevei]|nr:hypothetical protein [Serratia nevei]
MLQLGWRMMAGDGAPVEPSRENAPGPGRHIVFPQEEDIGKINDAHWFGRYQAAKDGEKAHGYKVGEWAIGAELLANAPEAAALGKIAGLLFSDNAKKAWSSSSMAASKPVMALATVWPAAMPSSCG